MTFHHGLFRLYRKVSWQILSEEQTNYFIVEASALPEVFHKVIQVQRLLELGEEPTAHSATKTVGISRSAYYKYKDLIRPFNDMLHGRIVTIQLLMHDQPGILSKVLAVFGDKGANILTINQNIPSAHTAVVTITAETSGLSLSPESFMAALSQVSGVIKSDLLAG